MCNITYTCKDNDKIHDKSNDVIEDKTDDKIDDKIIDIGEIRLDSAGVTMLSLFGRAWESISKPSPKS